MIKSFLTLKRCNTILYCQHWAETVHFYQEQLCLPVAFANDWFVEFQLTESSYLSIANAARATIDAVQGQGVTVTLEVANLANVKQKLERRGVATTAIQKKWGALAFYCQDPEGHRLEFWLDENDSVN